jgi:hypothetical protein
MVSKLSRETPVKRDMVLVLFLDPLLAPDQVSSLLASPVNPLWYAGLSKSSATKAELTLIETNLT